MRQRDVELRKNCKEQPRDQRDGERNKQSGAIHENRCFTLMRQYARKKTSLFFPPAENCRYVAASKTTGVGDGHAWRVINWRSYNGDRLELWIQFSDMHGNRSEFFL